MLSPFLQPVLLPSFASSSREEGALIQGRQFLWVDSEMISGHDELVQ